MAKNKPDDYTGPVIVVLLLIVVLINWTYTSALALKTMHPYWFYTALAFVVCVLLATLRYGARQWHAGHQAKKRSAPAAPYAFKSAGNFATASLELSHYCLQMKTLGLVSGIKPCPVLNSEEVNSFYAAKNVVKDLKNYHVHAQVSMWEFIKLTDPDPGRWNSARQAINSKRVDLLICDNFGNPALVIEYQGSGHDIGEDAQARNEVKQLALMLAGIDLLETFKEDSFEEIENKIRQKLINTASNEHVLKTLSGGLAV